MLNMQVDQMRRQLSGHKLIFKLIYLASFEVCLSKNSQNRHFQNKLVNKSAKPKLSQGC